MLSATKIAWLTELRSDQYKRSQFFREQNAYCPLGVLAKINGFDLTPNKKPQGVKIQLLEEYNGKVTSSYGWRKTVDNWPTPTEADTIIVMNAEDRGKKYTVTEIADWIDIHVFAT